MTRRRGSSEQNTHSAPTLQADRRPYVTCLNIWAALGPGASTRTQSGSGERRYADFAASDLENELGTRCRGLAQQPVHDSDEVTFEAAECLAAGLASAWRRSR